MSAAPSAVHAIANDLALDNDVSIDLQDAQVLAMRLLQPLLSADLGAEAIPLGVLSAELLPGWYDDWVLIEAESWRQLRLHALESLADALRDRQRFGEATAAAAAAIAADPLRESSRSTMIRIHLAEGNYSEAVREFERYRLLARRDLAREPSQRLRDMLFAS